MSFAKLQKELFENIKGVNRYNPENFGKLSACVQAMVNENKYDKDIVLTILKLYQLNPDKYDEGIVKLVLLKTLMVLPSSDFQLAKCLIDSKRAASPELKPIFDLGATLETCDFAVFWQLVKGTYKPSQNADKVFESASKIPKILAPITGFQDAVKNYACTVINVTFQNIEKNLLSKLLGGATAQEVAALAKKFGWEVKGDTYFLSNHEANIRTRNIDERIQFQHVAEILRNLETPLKAN